MSLRQWRSTQKQWSAAVSTMTCRSSPCLKMKRCFPAFFSHSLRLWIPCNSPIPFLEMGWAVPDTESLQIRTSHKVMQFVLQSHILWSKSNILFLVDGFLHNFSLPPPPSPQYSFWLWQNMRDLSSCTNLCSLSQCFLFHLLSFPELAGATGPNRSGEDSQSLQA